MGQIEGQLRRVEGRANSIPPPHLPPSSSLSAHLHHGVVAEAPFGATKHRSSINVDGPPALIGNEEITIVFQFDDTCGNKRS